MFDNGDNDNEQTSFAGHGEPIGKLAKNAAAARQMLKGYLGARHQEQERKRLFDLIMQINDQALLEIVRAADQQNRLDVLVNRYGISLTAINLLEASFELNDHLRQIFELAPEQNDLHIHHDAA